MNRLIAFVKKEVVLIVALLLALLSTLIIGPSKNTYSSIDLNTLMLLFSLMCVMQAFSSIGFFEKCGRTLLGKVHGSLGVIAVLVFLSFFFSMLITNDVALITFVPFAVIVLKMAGQDKLLGPVVVLQTIAANLGSMMLPMGNPQNLYLYNLSGLSLFDFVKIMAPYTALSFVLLLVCVFVLGKKNSGSGSESASDSEEGESGRVKGSFFQYASYTILFVFALLAVLKVVRVSAVFAVTLVYFLCFNRKVLKKVDYSLLITFTGFFIFVGNIKSLESFSQFLGRILVGHEVLLSVGLSQVISNVPASLLLSAFTDNYGALLIGVNLGGLGTLIASMASLISWKQIESDKGRYFVIFTVMSIVFLVFLVALNLLLGV